jgi:hypothetical protein
MSGHRFDFADFCARSDTKTDGLVRVLSRVQNGAWCAGGAIRRTIANMPLDSDFDFFFKSAEALAEWETKLPETLVRLRETQHHVHWRGPVGDSAVPVDIQAIRFRYYDSAEAVIDSFDYTITQFALDGTELVTTPYALWDLGRRRLAIHKVTYPVATMRRMLKYTSQGFTACAGCMATLLRETATRPEALASLDISYVD